MIKSHIILRTHIIILLIGVRGDNELLHGCIIQAYPSLSRNSWLLRWDPMQVWSQSAYSFGKSSPLSLRISSFLMSANLIFSGLPHVMPRFDGSGNSRMCILPPSNTDIASE